MPFFKYVRYITILGIVLFGGVVNAHTHPIEPIIFYTTKDIIQIGQGVNRPTPGNECESYFLTESDKICLISTPDVQTEPPAKINESDEQAISYEHQLENDDDMASLRDNLEYPEYTISENVESYNVLLMNSEPVLEDEDE